MKGDMGVILPSKYALTNVNVIDGTGKDVMKNMVVVISEGIITNIAEVGEYKHGEDTETIDMAGKTVMPGMIDTHVHLCGLKSFGEDLVTTNIIYAALRSVSQAEAMLKHGFTSVRDLSRSGLYLKRIIHQGLLTGPRIVSCGPGLSPTGGAIDIATCPIEIQELIQKEFNFGIITDGIDEIKKSVRTNLREGADQIKFFANGAEGSSVDKMNYRQFTVDEMKVIVKEARRIPGTKVLAHLQEPIAAWDCLEADIDTFEHLGYLDDNLCHELVERGKYLTPTIALESSFEDEFKDDGEELLASENGPFYHRDVDERIDPDEERDRTIGQFKLAHKMGVKMSLGSDSIDELLTPYGEYSIEELCTMVKYGMTELEAIKAACMIGSEVLGLENKIGTIENGKIADILIIDGNPAENINIMRNTENIEYVIQSGRITVDHQVIKR